MKRLVLLCLLGCTEPPRATPDSRETMSLYMAALRGPEDKAMQTKVIFTTAELREYRTLMPGALSAPEAEARIQAVHPGATVNSVEPLPGGQP